MNKILYIVRGFLICHGFIGDIYDTIWKDLNPNKPYNAPLYWHKYNDGNAKAFFSQTNNYGEIRGHVNNFEYEYIGKWFVDTSYHDNKIHFI